MVRFRNAAACAMALVATGLLSGAAPAAEFVVDSTDDAVDQSPGDGLCLTQGGACTLRAGVQEANAIDGPDEIVVPPGTYSLSLGASGDDLASSGDLDLAGDVTISKQGDPAELPFARIDGSGFFRIFEVPAGVTVTMEGIDLTNGFAVDGGAVFNRGTLALRHCEILENESTTVGGGIHNTGSLTVSTCRIAVNAAAAQGGGIANRTSGDGLDASVLLEEGSEFFQNKAAAGAGLSNVSLDDALALVEVRDSGVVGNIADDDGAGILNFAEGPGRAQLFLDRTLVRDNFFSSVSSQIGGGLFNLAQMGGEAKVFASNTTLSSNDALAHGGGLAQMEDSESSAEVSLANATVTENLADGTGAGLWGLGTFQLRNSLVAGNTNAVDGTEPDCAGLAFDSAGYNLIGELGSCTGATADDLTGIDPLLGARADNGGPTETHLLEPASPAVDGGNPSGCVDAEGLVTLSQDQRGAPRPESADGRCDIGAVELPEPRAGALALAALGALAALVRRRTPGGSRVDAPSPLG